MAQEQSGAFTDALDFFNDQQMLDRTNTKA